MNEKNLKGASVSPKNENENTKVNCTDKERFTTIIGRHADFLRELRKEGKVSLFEQTRARIFNQLHNDFTFAYHARTISWREYLALHSEMREKLSHENLLGIVQYSIFDQLTDDQLIENCKE